MSIMHDFAHRHAHSMKTTKKSVKLLTLIPESTLDSLVPPQSTTTVTILIICGHDRA